MENTEFYTKIAIFFDAENFSSKFVPKTLAEINRRGNVVIQRTYADWSSVNVKSWKDCVNKYPLTAIQVFRESINDKNDQKEAVDKQIIMDAIQTAVQNPDISIICIGASDKGYIPLALKLRELGKKVIGVGERGKAREGSKLVNACNEFLYVEDLQDIDENILIDVSTDEAKNAGSEAEADENSALANYSLLRFLNQCYELTPKVNSYSTGDGNGVVLHSQFMETILRQQPDFNVKTYGFKSFKNLLASFSDEYEVFDDGKRPPTYYAYRKENTVKQEIREGHIKRKSNFYGFIDSEGKDYYFYFGDVINLPEDKKIQGKPKVRFEVLKEPDPTAALTKDRNGIADKIELLP
ncbi:NYN domain-containing protein [Treponema pectinovorum]|uniref:NYN domain-containing protein n=1 Tax=Treponema pectinovorum TaxID=164 RepID=UPI0011C95A1A|nr:NYN domain-containing protein [Treponema pectinovorum]